MFCTKCGKLIENNDMVCPECGQFVEQDLSTQVAAQAQTHNPIEQASTPIVTPAPVFTSEPAPAAPATPTPVFVAPSAVAAPAPVYMSDTRVNSQPQLEEPMSVGDWIATMLLSAIPILGFIMMIVWAVGDKKTSRRNYARAVFIMFGIAIGITILLGIFVAIAGALL